MSDSPAGGEPIRLGDPVPWFGARTLAGGSVDLHVQGGRWIVLAFLGDLSQPRAAQELSELMGEAALFDEDKLVVYAVLTAPPPAPVATALAEASGPALGFLADYDGAVSRIYGALDAPRSIVIDPMLRAVANIVWDDGMNHAQMLRGFLRQLPDVDASAGVELCAPVLIVPRVFEFDFCDFLVGLHQEMGGSDSGFLFDQGGKTTTVIDHALKRRQDLVIGDPQLREIIRDRIVRRLLPPIERFFQYQATRMDRTMVCCYDSALGGHFYRHRDNVNLGAQHRRFAVTINLNTDYDGCDLVFPEFGRRQYRAPCGGAVVFSCGALHQVTPITRGRRYAFVPFLYGEADAALREANNAHLQEGEVQYTGGLDRLFPDA
jgi:predicted 2-oxoglutarate/Fe(II)-dependent dioxygenase YbiX/peroxiredoxin